jgi:hypothetical protein
VNFRHTAMLALVGWYLWMPALQPPKLTNVFMRCKQFDCFDSREQCDRGKNQIVTIVSQYWAEHDHRAAPHSLSAFSLKIGSRIR